MSYLDHFEDEDPDLNLEEDEDFLDEDWWPENEQSALPWITTTAAEVSQQFVLTEEAKARFLVLLLSDHEGAIEVVSEFMEEYDRPKPTEVFHTLWNGQETTDGFHVYHVNHGLNSTEVLVSLDTNELFTYSVKDANTVVVVCPEPLFGVDVEVRLK